MYCLPDEIKLALGLLNEAGYEAYVVGGAVRDMIAKRRVHDYDIASSASPSDVLRVFGAYKTVKTGLKHGTVTVIIGEYPVEITVFRRESAYSDGRHPDSVTAADSIEEDLSRRDFTINAMALSPDGKLIDPFGGRKDIKAKKIRCVGDPEKRFSEDRLRILRTLRFSSELCYDTEEKTGQAVRNGKELVLTVSAERVYAELYRLVNGDGAPRVLIDYADVICLILGIKQNGRYDSAAENIGKLPKDAVLRITALLSGCGADTAAAAAKRLRCSNAEAERMIGSAKYADADPQSGAELKRFINKAGFQTAKDVFAIRSLYDPHAEELLIQTGEIFDRGEPVFIKDLAVNGTDLIAAGATEGKETGELLDTLLTLVTDGKAENERNALIAAAKAILRKKT